MVKSKEKDFDRVYKLSTLIHKLMPLYDLDSNFSHLFKKLMAIRGIDTSHKSIFPCNQLSDKVFEKSKDILQKVVKEDKEIK